ncbi:MAG: tetratricopeptide repeat protein [Planctomycetota bacterium]|nr:tetratricopeptide repeat protein [Planctomycetota bacterium]
MHRHVHHLGVVSLVIAVGCGRESPREHTIEPAVQHTVEKPVVPTPDPVQERKDQAELIAASASDAINASRPDEAIRKYNEAIELDPHNADYYHGRGIAFFNKNEFDIAIADFNEAIRRDPTHSEAHRVRARARDELASRDKREGTVALFNNIVDADKELWGQDVDNLHVLDRGLRKVKAVDESTEYAKADPALQESCDTFVRLSYRRVALIRRIETEFLPRVKNLQGKIEGFEAPESLGQFLALAAQFGAGVAISEDLEKEAKEIERESNQLLHDYKSWSNEFDRPLRWKLFPKPRSEYAEEIEMVLDQDKAIGVADRSASTVATSMREIDLVHCPAEFRAAYRDHITAWGENDYVKIKETFSEVLRIAHEHGIDVSRFE